MRENEKTREMLKQHIKNNGIKQRWFAEKLGITEQYLCMFLSAKRDLPYRRLQDIQNLIKK